MFQAGFAIVPARLKALAESAIGNRILFQGREYSWKTGLYYFRNRWADPTVGRWLSNDPLGVNAGVNFYAMMGNNPVNFRDEFGLCRKDSGNMWDDFWMNVYKDLSGQDPSFVTYGLTETHKWVGKTRHESAMWWLEEGWYGTRNIGGFLASGFDERSYLVLMGGAGTGQAFSRYGIMNQNQYLRIGISRSGGRSVERLAGKIIQRFKKDGHIIYKDWGPL